MDNKEINALKLISIGSVVAEYGALTLVDNSKHELRQRTNRLVSSCQQVQNWFCFHPSANIKYTNAFKKEFNSNEMLFISKILVQLTALNEDGLEELHNQLEDVLKQI